MIPIKPYNILQIKISSYMSYMSAEERDKMLEDITKTSHRDLDEELKRKHVEIEDEFRIEQTKLQNEFKNQKN
jgi:hypothetical protein